MSRIILKFKITVSNADWKRMRDSDLEKTLEVIRQRLEFAVEGASIEADAELELGEIR